MAETRFELKPKVDMNATPSAVLGQRLLLAHSARLDFMRALEMAGGLPTRVSDPEQRNLDALLIVADSLDQAGLNYQPLIDQVFREVKTLSLAQRTAAYQRTVRLFGVRGSLPTAHRVLGLLLDEDGFEFPHFFVHRDLAKGYIALGIDPQPILEVARELAGKLPYGSLRRIEIRQEDRARVSDLVDIAELYQQVGLDHSPILSEADSTFQRLAQNSDPRSIYPWHAELAKAHATLGDITGALVLADGIVADMPEHTECERANVRFEIAKVQLKQGDLEGALKTVHDSHDETLIADIYARTAIINAESGQDNSKAVESALRFLALVPNERSQVIVYSMLGRAKALAHEDPTEFFHRALGITVKSDVPHHQTEDLRIIAKNLDAAGLDATPTFNMVLQAVDQIIQEEDDMYGIIERDMALDEIISEAINLGYFDVARNALPRLANRGEVRHRYIELVTQLAVAQAKAGLSRSEIMNLSREDIESLVTNNGDLKKAIDYFQNALGSLFS